MKIIKNNGEMEKFTDRSDWKFNSMYQLQDCFVEKEMKALKITEKDYSLLPFLV